MKIDKKFEIDKFEKFHWKIERFESFKNKLTKFLQTFEKIDDLL